jgi:hypothetical protein
VFARSIVILVISLFLVGRREPISLSLIGRGQGEVKPQRPEHTELGADSI